MKLLYIFSKLFSRFNPNSSKHNAPRSRYVNLAPTSEADEKGVYFEALSKAMTDPEVYNIALTGPYGSGKSSIIKSFLRKYPGRKNTLQISLASFIPNIDINGKNNSPKQNTTKQEIERSILQQILYGPDTDKLPHSRFKRISSPKWWTWLLTPVIIFSCFALWYLFQQLPYIVSGNFFVPFDRTNWFNFTCLVAGFCFLWWALYYVYRKSFGFSLRSISLKNVEITPEAASEESILNRHLDEIIYFFQSTKYDLVVIEDLDRFDDSDIFVTLREINALVNANAGVKRRVRFLYALRDDIFVSTDRTKFFEFIIPVIPIINYSNSIDMVLKQNERLPLKDKLDRQFLREVSRYLSDLRLIQNIFNEYTIYVTHLREDEKSVLNLNKLLSILIYKNVLPHDFAKLHEQKGIFYSIIYSRDLYIDNIINNIKNKIASVEAILKRTDEEFSKNLLELNRIYTMAAIEKIDRQFTHFSWNNEKIKAVELPYYDEFENFINSKNLMWGNGYDWYRTTFDDLQSIVDPNKTYKERKNDIELTIDGNKTKLLEKLNILKKEINTIYGKNFKEIIHENIKQSEPIFKGFGEFEELLKYLILEGFLDDTYYQYITLFHNVRISPSDNSFLMQIRGFKNPSPDFLINNPAEVIASMREEDFGQAYVLNRYLIDYLLANQNQGNNREHIKLTLNFISDNFDICRDFFSIYYASGQKVRELVNLLTDKWEDFASTAIKTETAYEHIANIIAYVPTEKLVNTLNTEASLTTYLSSKLDEVMAQKIPYEFEKLRELNVKIDNIEAIAPYEEILDYIIQESLYTITASNIRFILERSKGSAILNDLETKHYTTILKSGLNVLLQNIENNFIPYFRNVLLLMQNDTNEDIDTIIKVLAHNDIPTELRENFLVRQNTSLTTFEGVPNLFHSTILENEKIEISWENILSYFDSEVFDDNILTNYMKLPKVKHSLKKYQYSDTARCEKFSAFIFNNEIFSDDDYTSYIKKLPVYYITFPENSSDARRIILIDASVVRLNDRSFNQVKDNDTILSHLLARNITTYLNNKSAFPISDAIRILLLKSDISNSEKLAIIQDIGSATICDDHELAGLVGSILNQTGSYASIVDSPSIQAIIVNTKNIDIQISLFNHFSEKLTFEELKEVIKNLPAPFSKIGLCGSRPKIAFTDENETLSTWLVKRKIISSFKHTSDGKKICLYPFRNHRRK